VKCAVGLSSISAISFGAFEAAVDEQEAAETRFKATLSPIVALSLGPNGERPSGGLEYRKFNTQAIDEEIRRPMLRCASVIAADMCS